MNDRPHVRTKSCFKTKKVGAFGLEANFPVGEAGLFTDFLKLMFLGLRLSFNLRFGRFFDDWICSNRNSQQWRIVGFFKWFEHFCLLSTANSYMIICHDPFVGLSVKWMVNTPRIMACCHCACDKLPRDLMATTAPKSWLAALITSFAWMRSISIFRIYF